jgi:hypothetical protein
MSQKRAGKNQIKGKISHCAVRPEICVKMFIFKEDVQSVHLETKCTRVKLSQGKNVTVDVSSGSKCHCGRNVGGRNIKTPYNSRA